MKRFWRCLSPLTFFGLSDDYQKSVYDQFFYLKYYGGWSVFESYNLPVSLRKWFVEKLINHMKEEAEEVKKQSKQNR
jgi:hypothetical protein